jgi:molecular chaperone DnaK (HSP70)
MDNRLNHIRKEMSALRADMLRAEDVIRDQVNRDQDCTEAALRVLQMRARMKAMVAEWKLLGGSVQLPTVEERLKEMRGQPPRRRPRYARPPMIQKSVPKRRRAAKA